MFSQARILVSSLILALAFCLLSITASAEQLICKVILNQVDKGDLFIDRPGNGDFLVKTEDLKSIGFRLPLGNHTLLDGDEYLSLSSMAGVTFTFDEGALSLALTANPSLLGKETVDFFAKQTQRVYYPQDSSIFLNYGADYLAGNGFSFSSFNLTNQLGARKGNVLFLTDSVFTKDQNSERFIRLQSSLTYDDRKELQRFIAGDFFASSGELGSSLNMGGISFAKIYRIDPYFINYPTLGLAGQIALPSEAKIYLNGMLMKTEKFSPGEFELKNITPYGAAGAIEVVLKDPFGREQRLAYPFYFAGSSLLKQGLHEYSYNLGFIREQFGTESNRYSNLAFSAFHRYGFSDSFTLGFRAEARNDLYNLGPQATFLPGNAGLFNLSLAGSTGRSSNTGGAGIVTYVYQGLRMGANLSLAGFTSDYKNLAANPASVRPKTQVSAGLSYTDKLLGSLSVGYSATRMYLGQETGVASVSYSRNWTSQFSSTATYRNIKETGYANEFYIALNYSPKPDLFVSASYQAAKDSKSSVLEVQKNPPIGEGLGYRVILNRSDAAEQAISTANPSLQYNGRYGIYQGEFNGQQSSGHLTEQYHLAASGALVYAANTMGATRPVYDSFGLVKVGNLEGIKVLLNSQEMGVTDASGKLFIPNLVTFNQNQVAIDDKQIPIEYFLSNVVKVVSPPLRSGSCIPFIAKKLQPITGILKIRLRGEIMPVEFQEVTLTINGKEIVFPTGTGGAFDIDLSQSEEFKKLTEAEESGCASIVAGSSLFIKPGIYRGTVSYRERLQHFSLTIPDSPAPIIDLGQIVFDASKETEKVPTMMEVPNPGKKDRLGSHNS